MKDFITFAPDEQGYFALIIRQVEGPVSCDPNVGYLWHKDHGRAGQFHDAAASQRLAELRSAAAVPEEYSDYQALNLLSQLSTEDSDFAVFPVHYKYTDRLHLLTDPSWDDVRSTQAGQLGFFLSSKRIFSLFEDTCLEEKYDLFQHEISQVDKSLVPGSVWRYEIQHYQVVNGEAVPTDETDDGGLFFGTLPEVKAMVKDMIQSPLAEQFMGL